MAQAKETGTMPTVDVDHAEDTTTDSAVKDKLKHGDEALKFMAAHDIQPNTPEEEKKVLRKIDWRLLPILMLLNTLQLVDKTTLSTAAAYGLVTQANLQGQEYSLLASLFYIGYLIAEYPSNYLMQKFPTGKYLTVNVVLWGIALTCAGACRSFPGLAASRFFLGFFEAPLNPGLVQISSAWWKTDEQPARIQLWYCSAGFVNLVVTLAFYGIAHIQVGDMFAYQWMFLIIGLFTVLVGTSLWWVLPDSPMTCFFLSDRERVVAVRRVESNQTGIKNREHKRYQVIEALKDPAVWILVLGVFLQNMTNGLQGSFLTLIIRGLGYDTFQTILLSMPISAIYGVFCLIIAWWLSTSWGKGSRIWTIMVCYLPGVISTVLLYVVPSSRTQVHLFAIYFINIISTNAGIIYSLIASNIAGYTKKSVVNSIFFIAYSTANIIAPQAFLSREAPTYRTGIAVTLASFCLNIILFGCLWFLYTARNRKRHQEIAELPPLSEEEQTVLSFSDKTDKENRRLIYSL